MTDLQQRDATVAGGKSFDLGDVLSITTGRLVSLRHMAGIYDILNFMTGDDLYTHQLGRGMEKCAPALFAQHPSLKDVECPAEFTPETWRPWLDAQKRINGESLTVAPLANGEWTSVDPLLELETMVGKERVISVEV